MKKILVINGANINMIGIREKNIYGESTYEDLVAYINASATELGLDVEIFQSNIEGEIVNKIQEAYNNKDGIVINAGGYTHTSICIMDALKAVSIPTVEVHLSDINSREDYRKFSYIAEVAQKRIMGKGFLGYKEALEYFVK